MLENMSFRCLSLKWLNIEASILANTISDLSETFSNSAVKCLLRVPKVSNC